MYLLGMPASSMLSAMWPYKYMYIIKIGYLTALHFFSETMVFRRYFFFILVLVAASYAAFPLSVWHTCWLHA